MRWKAKARIQNVVSLLPSGLSYSVYYWLQRRFGGLRDIAPLLKLTTGIEICGFTVAHGRSPVGRTFVEIGTG